MAYTINKIKESFKTMFNLKKILAAVTVGLIGFLIAVAFIPAETKSENTNTNVDSTRITQYQLAQAEFNETRRRLTIEIDNYIRKAAPRSKLDAMNIIDLCSRYNVDVRLVLVQGHIESHFGTCGTASRTNSVFNVGAFDGHSAKAQIKNGYGFKHPDHSVEPYLKLLKKRYLVNGRTEKDLLRNFVDRNGKRYASSRSYERALKAQWKRIDRYTNIDSVYNEYLDKYNRLNNIL